MSRLVSDRQREKFRIRRQLFGLLRDGGTAATVLFGSIQLVQVVMPALMALATAAVIGAADKGSGAQRVVAPLAMLAAMLVVAQVLAAIRLPTMGVVEGRINLAHRERMAHLVSGCETITAVEQPAVQDGIAVANAEPSTWIEKTPGQGATAQLMLVVRYFGLVTSGLVLTRFSWWLLPVLVLPAVAYRLIELKRWREHFRMWGQGISLHRRYQYWSKLAFAPAEGKEIRVFGTDDWISRTGQEYGLTHMRPVWANDFQIARAKWVQSLLVLCPLLLAFLAVGIQTAHGNASLSAEAVVLTAAWSAFQVMSNTFDSITIEGAVPVLQAYNRLTSALKEDARGASEIVASSLPGIPILAFHGVAFRYPDTDRDVLEGFDLEIEPGEMLALVGMNGAGKSTFTKLLGGLYEPTAGSIRADGREISDLGYTAWRRELAIVFQDFVRYPLTALENVTLGADADQDLLDAAALEAGFNQVLEQLPRGWHTPLSKERAGGVDLSGGQWQQVVLTRAIYAVKRGAKILVLDEPTAHLDVRTEFEVFERLAGTTRQATVILISHRLSTVRLADRIVLLEDGRITESGTHEELIGRAGRYAAMFAIQAERFQDGFADRAEVSELP